MLRAPTRTTLIICISILVATIASLFALPLLRARLASAALPLTRLVAKSYYSNTAAPTPSIMTANKKAPVYYFSHGGPNVQYETGHPAYPILQKIGKEITHVVKPKAVIVISGHWQSDGGFIDINSSKHTDLIYDFYGFPPFFYEAKYPSVGDPELAKHIQSVLADAGIKSNGVKRGLDHGVWSGFTVAFDPEKNPLNVPLVQVSLFGNESPRAHYALGRALAEFRSQNIVIIGAGMSVHNLRDLRFSMRGGGPLPYVKAFDDALKDAVESDPKVREQKMEEVARLDIARQAHPHMDHLMPVYVAAGAAGEDVGKQTWTLQEASMAWAQYRFGELPA